MGERGNLPTQADVDEIDRRLGELQEEQLFLKQRRAFMMLAAWEIEIGDVVRSTGRRFGVGTLGMVAAVRPPYRLDGDKPWVEVRLPKKDGSFGNRVVHFFGDWEKVSALSETTGEGK